MRGLTRGWQGACVCALWCWALLAAPAAHAAVTVVRVAITVSELTRATAFFHDVLGFEADTRRGHLDASWATVVGLPAARAESVRLRLGTEELELVHYPETAGRPVPADMSANDRAFQHVAIVVSDMATAYARLRSHGVRHASSAPQRLPASIPAAAGIEAFYFRDPDGHFLELLQFPAGKGDPRWQAPGRALLRGLDHTAIVVADGGESMRFWRDVLGLSIAGTSENQGTEQEHLNGVFGAHVLITTLRGAAGPGVEFLQYLFPTNGRGAPADTRANDLWHWHVEIEVDDFARVDSQLTAAGYVSPSRRAVILTAREDRPARLWRDPDGHAVLVVARSHR